MPTETVVHQGDRSLMILYAVSTDRGTELAFEIRDPERQAQCVAGKGMDMNRVFGEVRLRDEEGRFYAITRAGGSLSVGQHRFGFFGRKVLFDPLRPEVRRVTLEVRSQLGDWDVPIDLAPIGATSVSPQHEVDARAERHGITVRTVGIATIEAETILELEATAAPPVTAVRGIGSEFMREGAERLELLDDRGRRYEELLPSEVLPRPKPSEGGRTMVAFPLLPADVQALTLVVGAVTVQEPEGSLTLDLPVEEPSELSFGAYSLRVLSARMGTARQRPPSLTPDRPAVMVTIAPGAWHGDRRAMKPARTLIDGAERFHGWGRGADADVLTFEIPVGEADRPRTVTLAEPIVRIRGPWEVRFTRPL
jgi:hypothetical protein